MKDETPQYAHDCDHCRFLGRYTWGHRAYDLYWCPQDMFGPTIVARMSSDPPDYTSGMGFGRIMNDAAPNTLIWGTKDYDHPLGEAWRRARALGLDVYSGV